MKRVEILSNGKNVKFTTNAKNLKKAISMQVKKNSIVFSEYEYAVANIFDENGKKEKAYMIECNDNDNLKYIEMI